MTKQAAVWAPLESLKPWEKNPRINEHAVEKIAASIKAYGFASPIVAQEGTGRIIAGHTRWKAAKSLGMEEVPVRYLPVTDEQATALTIADNRLGDLAVWDETLLGTLLEGLEGSMDLEVLGFDGDELAALLGRWEDPFADAPEEDEEDEEDMGVAVIKITVPIPVAQDLSESIRALLAEREVSDFDLKVV